MDARSGPSEFKKALMVVERDDLVAGQDRTGLTGVELDLLLPDDVVPAHPDVGGLVQGDRVVHAQGHQCMAVLERDARHLPDRHAGDVDHVAVVETGDVAQLRLDRVPAVEQGDVADPHRQADEQDDADQREDRELEGGGREVTQEPPHGVPPSIWLTMLPRLVPFEVSG
jgi:hypothetical protein